MTDCAKWLNGRGVGARYDGTYEKDGEGSYYIGSCDGKSTGSVEALSRTEKDNIKTFIGAQMAAYEKATGWIFWTWKTEGAPEWDFQALNNAGLIPESGGEAPSISLAQSHQLTVPVQTSGHAARNAALCLASPSDA